MGTLTLQISNVPALDDSLVLAAWIIDETGKIVHKFGKLTYPNGATSYTGSFPLSLSDYQENTKNQFVCVSIEYRDSTLSDTATSNTFLLISKIRNNSSSLSVVPKKLTDLLFGSDFDDQKYVGTDTSSAVPPSFTTATGKYTVFTPTDINPNTSNGIWFLNYVSAGTYTKALRIPELPSGWTYKGWVNIDGKYLSLGEFTTASGNDAQNPFVGANALPGYPGEDFIQNAPAGFTFPLDLSGKQVLISLEPTGFAGYDHSKPFPLYFFKGTIPSSLISAPSAAVQPLTNNADTFPKGTAVYSVNVY